MKAKIENKEGVYFIRFYDHEGKPVDCFVVDKLEILLKKEVDKND